MNAVSDRLASHYRLRRSCRRSIPGAEYIWRMPSMYLSLKNRPSLRECSS